MSNEKEICIENSDDEDNTWLCTYHFGQVKLVMGNEGGLNSCRIPVKEFLAAIREHYQDMLIEACQGLSAPIVE